MVNTSVLCHYNNDRVINVALLPSFVLQYASSSSLTKATETTRRATTALLCWVILLPENKSQANGTKKIISYVVITRNAEVVLHRKTNCYKGIKTPTPPTHIFISPAKKSTLIKYIFSQSLKNCNLQRIDVVKRVHEHSNKQTLSVRWFSKSHFCYHLPNGFRSSFLCFLLPFSLPDSVKTEETIWLCASSQKCSRSSRLVNTRARITFIQE